MSGSTSRRLARTATTSVSYFLINANSTTSASGNEIKIDNNTTDQQIEGMISAVDSMMTNLTDSASKLGAVNSRISMQNDFVNNLQDVISKGVGRLVDADMNEESTS